MFIIWKISQILQSLFYILKNNNFNFFSINNNILKSKRSYHLHFIYLFIWILYLYNDCFSNDIQTNELGIKL